MAFLRAGLGQDAQLIVRGEQVMLRPLAMVDYPVWAELRAHSRAHLTPWEPAWTHDELTRGAFRRRLRHYHRELREDLGYAFGVFEEPGSQLAGGLSLSNVRRGVTQAAALGYWLGLPHVGKGLMTRALRALSPFAFHDLRLHRLEAACMPSNGPSIAVLERCGFAYEGLARRYLKINGVWQDHLLYSLISDEDRSDARGRYLHEA